MEDKHNEPAFPQPIASHGNGMYTSAEKFPSNAGMSLRDWFAGMALQGMLACSLYSPDKVLDSRVPAKWDGPDGWGAFLSGTAYKYADAMLAERQKGM